VGSSGSADVILVSRGFIGEALDVLKLDDRHVELRAHGVHQRTEPVAVMPA
jgi:hypothetical protein